MVLLLMMRFYVFVKETSHRVSLWFSFHFCFSLYRVCHSKTNRFIGQVTQGHRSIGLEEGARRAQRRRNRWRQAMTSLSCDAMPSTKGSVQPSTTLEVSSSHPRVPPSGHSRSRVSLVSELLRWSLWSAPCRFTTLVGSTRGLGLSGAAAEIVFPLLGAGHRRATETVSSLLGAPRRAPTKSWLGSRTWVGVPRVDSLHWWVRLEGLDLECPVSIHYTGGFDSRTWVCRLRALTCSSRLRTNNSFADDAKSERAAANQ